MKVKHYIETGFIFRFKDENINPKPTPFTVAAIKTLQIFTKGKN